MAVVVVVPVAGVVVPVDVVVVSVAVDVEVDVEVVVSLPPPPQADSAPATVKPMSAQTAAEIRPAEGWEGVSFFMRGYLGWFYLAAGAF